MAVFLSTYLNKVDKKGRVSVPSQFRAVLAKQSLEGTATGLVVFRSLQFSALEACSPEHMEKLAADLEQMDISAEERRTHPAAAGPDGLRRHHGTGVFRRPQQDFPDLGAGRLSGPRGRSPRPEPRLRHLAQFDLVGPPGGRLPVEGLRRTA